MTAIAEHVLTDTLSLKPVERAELIGRLFQNFDCSVDPSIDDAWANEIEKRIDAYDNGKISASPAQDVFHRISQNSKLQWN